MSPTSCKGRHSFNSSPPPPASHRNNCCCCCHFNPIHHYDHPPSLPPRHLQHSDSSMGWWLLFYFAQQRINSSSSSRVSEITSAADNATRCSSSGRWGFGGEWEDEQGLLFHSANINHREEKKFSHKSRQFHRETRFANNRPYQPPRQQERPRVNKLKAEFIRCGCTWKGFSHGAAVSGEHIFVCTSVEGFHGWTSTWE